LVFNALKKDFNQFFRISRSTMELLNKILEIQFEKTTSEIEGTLNSEAVRAEIDSSFKDICIELRSSKGLFDSYSVDGYCEVSVFNDFLLESGSYAKSKIENLSVVEIIERMEFYYQSLFKSKEYLKRSPSIYNNIDRCKMELKNILNGLNPHLSKQQIFEKHGRQIEFFNQELFYNLFQVIKLKLLKQASFMKSL
jgi:hypothetical protein